MPAPHPVEFRQRAVALARTGDKPTAVLAKELQISESCLRNWIAPADADDGGNDSRLTSAEKELAELRRRNRQLETENACGGLLRAGEHPPKVAYRLVRELADDGFDVAVTCRLLSVFRSGYYEWKDRPASPRDQENELLLKHIKQIHKESRETYGSPRIHAELTMGLGLPVNVKRMARLMRQAGVQGLSRWRRRGCTVRDPHAEPATDLVDRQFGLGFGVVHDGGLAAAMLPRRADSHDKTEAAWGYQAELEPGPAFVFDYAGTPTDAWPERTRVTPAAAQAVAREFIATAGQRSANVAWNVLE